MTADLATHVLPQLPHEALEIALGAALYAESQRNHEPSAAAARSRARLARRLERQGQR